MCSNRLFADHGQLVSWAFAIPGENLNFWWPTSRNMALVNSVALQAGDTVVYAARLLGTAVKSMPITSTCGERTYFGLSALGAYNRVD